MTIFEAFNELIFNENANYKIGINVENVISYRSKIKANINISIDIMEVSLKRAKYIKLKDGNWIFPIPPQIMEIDI